MVKLVCSNTMTVGAAPTTSSFSASMNCTKTAARRDEKHLSFGLDASYITVIMLLPYAL